MGVWGIERRYCLMIGGPGTRRERGHSGIEYGLMQTYAEGFDILRNKGSKDLPEDERFALNMPDIAEVWRRGSVISFGLLDPGAAAFGQKMLSAMRFGFGGHIEGNEPIGPEPKPASSPDRSAAKAAAK